MPGEVYDKAGEKLVIINVRNGVVYPFQAPGFIDLRVGFFLSITGATADDDPSGAYAETLSNVTTPDERYWIGLKTNNTLLPRAFGTSFIGFSNTVPLENGTTEDPSASMLVSSDGGIGTTNTNFWRPTTDGGQNPDETSAVVIDASNVLAFAEDGTQIHFVQDSVAGYATLLGIRITRDTPTSTILRASFKSDVTAHSGDLLFSSTPTTDLIRDTIEDWPTVSQTFGPFQVTRALDALFFYWPFRNSRLRIHSVGVLKKA